MTSAAGGAPTSTARAAVAAPWTVAEALARVETTLHEATESNDPLLTEMARDLIRAGGKRLRPRITLLAFQACGGADPSAAVAAAAASELIHTASLVHDDIIDRSPLRRGRATVHARHGLAQAIVTGDFLFTKGFALSGQLTKEVVATTAEACAHLAEGEVMEQRLAGQGLTEEDYLTIIRYKTAEPVRAVAKAGALLAGAPRAVVEALGEYGLNLGMAFQVTDDLLDIVGDPAVTGKDVGQDLRLGIMTIPMGLNGKRVALDPDAPLAELRVTLEQSGAIGRARSAARRYARRAQEALEILPDSPARRELAALADQVVVRER